MSLPKQKSSLLYLVCIGWLIVCLSACGIQNTSTPEPVPTSTIPAEAATSPAATAIESDSNVILQRNNPQRTGVYDIPAIREQPELHWQARIGHTLLVSPVVVDALLYTTSLNGTLYALDAETGEEVWSVTGVGQHEYTGAIIGDMLIAAGVSRQVRAWDRKTGEELWTFKTNYLVQGSPLVLEDQVYIATDREVYALTVESGELIWSTATGEEEAYMGAPAYQDGIIYTTAGRVLLALDSQTGDELWRARKIEMFLGLAVANDMVYVGNWDRTLYAFDRQTGEELWQFQAEGELWSYPAVTAEIVYAGNMDQLYALDAQSGELIWSFQAGGAPVSEPLITDGVIYITDGNHEVRRRPLHLYALDASTGEQLWVFETVSTFLPAPALGEGVMYLSSTGEVIALKE